jgi:hypothetical protein
VSKISQSKHAYVLYQNASRFDRDCTFSYPDFTVGSGLSPDPATHGRLAGLEIGSLQNRPITAGRELRWFFTLTLPRRFYLIREIIFYCDKFVKQNFSQFLLI